MDKACDKGIGGKRERRHAKSVAHKFGVLRLISKRRCDRLCGALLRRQSFRQKKIITNITALVSAISQNIPCQEPNSSIAPPNNGPTIGAIAMMITSVESICAACELPKRSLCILRFWLGSTSVLRPRPRPEIRAKKSATIASDIAQPTEPIANSAIPMKSGILRPIIANRSSNELHGRKADKNRLS